MNTTRASLDDHRDPFSSSVQADETQVEVSFDLFQDMYAGLSRSRKHDAHLDFCSGIAVE